MGTRGPLIGTHNPLGHICQTSRCERTHPEVVAARRQHGFVGVELLLASDQGDVAQQAVFPLLVEGGEDGVLVGLGLAQPLSRQHLPAANGTQMTGDSAAVGGSMDTLQAASAGGGIAA